MKYSPPRRHRGVWQRAGGLHPLGWVGGETGNGELVDVAAERTAVQQVSRDIVQPEALTQIVEFLRRIHRVISR